jgi:hypothetical protein
MNGFTGWFSNAQNFELIFIMHFSCTNSLGNLYADGNYKFFLKSVDSYLHFSCLICVVIIFT